MPSKSAPLRLPPGFVAVEKTLPSGKTITVVRVRPASRSNKSRVPDHAPTRKRKPTKKT